MNNTLFYREILVLVISIITLIYFSIKYFKGGVITKPERAVASMKKFVIKNGRRITTFLYIILLFLCLTVIFNSKPLIEDIPNLINGKYSSIEGTAMNDSKEGNKRKIRTVFVLDATTNKKVRIRFYGRHNIEKGDYLKLYFYPNSKIGAYQNPEEDK